MSFSRGDSIMYPHYGAGTIVDQTTIDRDGPTEYHVIDIFLSNREVKLPVGSIVDHDYARPVRDPSSLENELDQIASIESNFLDRGHPEKIDARDLPDWIESAEQCDLATSIDLFCRLHTRYLTQSIGMNEKKAYDTARTFLVSEIMAVRNLSRNQAFEYLLQYAPRSLPEKNNAV